MSLSHKFEVIEILRTVLDDERALAVYEHRRVTIKKPLTAYGAKRLAAKLAQWGDANEAADIMIDRLWQGFEVDWAARFARPRSTGNGLVDALIGRPH